MNLWDHKLAETSLIDHYLAQSFGRANRYAHEHLQFTTNLIGVPSENGPYRTLVLSGGWNPSIERRHGNAEIAGYISWWHPAGEQFLGAEPTITILL
jgi:hypothetical protein